MWLPSGDRDGHSAFSRTEVRVRALRLPLTARADRRVERVVVAGERHAPDVAVERVDLPAVDDEGELLEVAVAAAPEVTDLGVGGEAHLHVGVPGHEGGVGHQ